MTGPPRAPTGISPSALCGAPAVLLPAGAQGRRQRQRGVDQAGRPSALARRSLPRHVTNLPLRLGPPVPAATVIIEQLSSSSAGSPDAHSARHSPRHSPGGPAGHLLLLRLHHHRNPPSRSAPTTQPGRRPGRPGKNVFIVSVKIMMHAAPMPMLIKMHCVCCARCRVKVRASNAVFREAVYCPAACVTYCKLPM